MPGQITEVEIRGVAHSWEHVKLTFDGDQFNQFLKIDYDDDLDAGFAWGNGKAHAPIARGGGKYTPGVLKLEGLKGAVQRFREWVAAKAKDGKSYGTVIFGGMLQYLAEDDIPITVEFREVKWKKNGSSDGESSDPLKEIFELQPKRILRNGTTLYDSSDEV